MIYFISGHLDLSKNDFEKYYQTKIDDAILTESSFLIGDAKGLDLMAQEYLKKYSKIIIYHMFDKARFNIGNWETVGGFKNDTERDFAMTSNSDIDIAYVRPTEESEKLYGKNYNPKRISGTEKNILRRKKRLFLRKWVKHFNFTN